jgi:tetratricopeptide (TPR) repeat protein
LQGLFYSDKGTEEALRKSLKSFQRALDKDPRFSRAWTGIAKAWLWLADVYVPPLQAYPKVREAADKALKIDPEDAEARVYVAETKRILDWELDQAEVEYKRAFEIDPNSTSSNYFIAAFYGARGDRDQALAYLQRRTILHASFTVTSDFTTKRLRLANAPCNWIRLSLTASRCSVHYIARWGALMKQLPYTNDRRTSAADRRLASRSPMRV